MVPTHNSATYANINIDTLGISHTSTPDLAIQLYQDVTSSHFKTGTILPKTFYRVLNMAEYQVGDKVQDRPHGVICDSRDFTNDAIRYFPKEFFVCDQTQTATHGLDYSSSAHSTVLRKVLSMRPFNPIYGATGTFGNTRVMLRGAGYDKSAEANPTAMIYKYRLQCDEELARFLKFNQPGASITGQLAGYTDFMFPLSQNPKNDNLVHVKSMSLDWRNESYSVVLNNLPIKNFKNTSSRAQGGFSKAIVGSIPAPFQISASSDQIGEDRTITSIFEPNFPVVSKLYNQALTTNFFDVQIKRLKTDKPAAEITRSVVSITIMPPDNYKGNLNTIAAL
jgi:hypothetical protein